MGSYFKFLGRWEEAKQARARRSRAERGAWGARAGWGGLPTATCPPTLPARVRWGAAGRTAGPCRVWHLRERPLCLREHALSVCLTGPERTGSWRNLSLLLHSVSFLCRFWRLDEVRAPFYCPHVDGKRVSLRCTRSSSLDISRPITYTIPLSFLHTPPHHNAGNDCKARRLYLWTFERTSPSRVDLLGAKMYCNFILMYFDLWLFISFFKKNICSKTFLNVGRFSKKGTLFSKTYFLVSSNLGKEKREV